MKSRTLDGGEAGARHSPRVVVRLRIAFSLLVAIAIGAGAAGIVGLMIVSRGFDRVTDASTVLQKGALEPSQSFLAMSLAARKYELSQDPEAAEAYRSAQTAFDRSMSAARAKSMDRKIDAQLATVAAAAAAWEAGVADPIFAGRSRTVSYGSRVGLNEKFQTAIGRLRVQLEARSRSFASSAASTRRDTILVVALLAGIAALAGLAGSTFAAASLSRPLEALRDAVARIGRKEVGARAPSGGPAEIDEVSRAVNALAEVAEQSDRARAETRRIRELSQSVATRIRESLDLDDVLTDGVREVGLALGADRAIVRLISDGRLGRHQTVWTRSGIGAVPIQAHELTVAETKKMERRLREHGAVLYETPLDISDEIPTLRRWHESMGTQAIAAVPLVAADQFLGSLALYQTQKSRRFTDREVDLLRTVSTDFARGVLQAQLYRRSQEVAQRLREIDQAKTEFISTVTHELRTPLTSVIAYLELIRVGDAGEVSDEQAELLAVVDRNLTRLHQLIEDLLTVSRIESSSFALDFSPLVVASALDDAVAMVQPTAVAAGISITYEDGLRDTMINGDSRQLYRIFTNLLTNAVKFSSAGSEVVVWSQAVGGEAVIEVRDRGIGIPAADQRRLCTRFFRAANASASSIPGTGLGLSIAREIAERHGGSLVLSSEEGYGTTARVELPLVEPG